MVWLTGLVCLVEWLGLVVGQWLVNYGFIFGLLVGHLDDWLFGWSFG